MKRFLLGSITIIAFLVSIIGCGGGGRLSSEPPTEGTVTGTVKNFSTGKAIQNARIVLGNKSAVTDANGSFKLDKIDLSGRMILKIEKAGFMHTSKILNLQSRFAEANFKVKLMPTMLSGTFDPTSDYNIFAGDNSIGITANSLVDRSGNQPTGDVTYEFIPVSLASTGVLVLPGEMTTASGDLIESYGTTSVVFKDSVGNMLDLDTGKTALVHVAVSAKGGAAPDSALLYYYNENDGIWTEGPTVALSADKKHYSATISRLGVLNVGGEYETIKVHGCIKNLCGKAAKDAVVHMEGFSYNGMSTAYTDLRGEFTILAKKNETSLITASRGKDGSNTMKVENASTDVNLTGCLLVGDIPVIARLTWGASPSDLDTHVAGPNNYHIWYRHLGDLFNNELAKLDVDDTTSYGPEVFTALSFPTTGIYHYAVYNFSGTHTPNITNSPAKVEVAINGKSSVFTPPSGENNTHRWWNVFDIVVAADGKISMIPVNTWSVDASGPAPGRKVVAEVELKKK